ncbi:peptide transporter ptr2 [Hypoxylon texense]
MSLPTGDTVVSIYTPLPRRYIFVPKGNAYITGNCRKKTRGEGRKVYVVHNSKHQPMGIRVPYAIYESVLEKHNETQESRAKAVEKKDNKVKADFRASITSQFPEIPEGELTRIVEHATRKYSRRVGRTGTLDLAKKAQLAVRAHIRHLHTEYDKILADGALRDDARSRIYKKVEDVAMKWGWKSKPNRRSEIPLADIPNIAAYAVRKRCDSDNRHVGKENRKRRGG